MFNTTKTIYSVMLDVANLLDKNHVVLPNTTLNEKFHLYINNTEQKNPKLRYYCLGLEYESLIQNTNMNIDTIRHKPTDGALFRHVPFIARRKNNDLSNTEKARYRLRIERTIDNEDYVFYFLKLIDDIDVNSKLLYVTNDSDETFLSLFSTEVDHILTPTIEERDKVNDSLIDYIAYSQHATITITDAELDELYAACKLYYGDDVEVVLGELALVSGNETLAPDGYSEIANAQINYFLKVDHILTDINLNNKFKKTIELGGMSPMVFRTYND